MSQEKNSKKSQSGDSHERGDSLARSSTSGADAVAAPASHDVVLIHGVTEDKKGLRVLRARPEGIELGEVRPIKEGQPLNHDLVRLKPREGAPYICDVHTEFSVAGRQSHSASDVASRDVASRDAASRDAASRDAASEKQAKGPAQVATQTYRDGWDAIWASGRKSGNELN